ncbi:MAG TPA: isoamylase early set domain-containing protein [Anaerolineales bacterium]|nr:isoamylase early set domain-containing protein [Anaerolineales bacterium]
MVRKEYTKTGRSCRVTFSLPTHSEAEKICLVGDFNEWNPSIHPMKRGKDGNYNVTISLKPGQAYDFRYLLDGKRWENDWEADGIRSNTYGSENSVVMV